MKYLLYLGLIPGITWANYQKPELLARYFSTNNYNLPINSYCYMGTPMAFAGNVIINCVRDEYRDLMLWDREGKSSTFYSTKNFVSTPQYVNNMLTWYEYDLTGVKQIHQWKDGIRQTTKVDGEMKAVSFLGNEWIYQGRDSLTVKSGSGIYPSDIEDISYVFSPSVSSKGEYAVKIRRISDANSSPDEIWIYKNKKWLKVFGDTDSNPESPWKDFRNNLTNGDGKVFVIAQDKDGEALLEITPDGERILARAGRDLKAFEPFQIAYNNGTIAFRGVDFQNRKVIYAYDGELKRVLTQGDTIMTDFGEVAKIHYHDRDAVIYNNPAVGDEGEVIVQGTLTDFEDNTTLIGVGVIRIKRESH